MKARIFSAKPPALFGMTLDLPILESSYVSVIQQLNSMGMGDALKSDCRVAEIESKLPILKRLEGQSVNIDELDCLARQTEHFSRREAAQFQAMAFTRGYTRMEDFLNLSPIRNFQRMTVIRDFISPGKDGWAHYTMLHPTATKQELEKIDGYQVAMDLILHDHRGRITPFGVAYDFTQEMKHVYDRGGPLPPLNDKEGVMELSVFPVVRGESHPMSFLRLPMDELRLERLMERGGITEAEELSVGVSCIGCDLRQLPEDFDSTTLSEYNRLAQRIAELTPEDNQKLIAVKEFAKATTVPQILRLADNLLLFRVKGDSVTYHGTESLAELMTPDTQDTGMEMGGMA